MEYTNYDHWMHLLNSDMEAEEKQQISSPQPQTMDNYQRIVLLSEQRAALLRSASTMRKSGKFQQAKERQSQAKNLQDEIKALSRSKRA
jgi:hypothetical protein